MIDDDLLIYWGELWTLLSDAVRQHSVGDRCRELIGFY